MARSDAERFLVNGYDQSLTVTATLDPAQWPEPLVTVTFSDPDETGCSQLAMTVADAHRLCVALYSVISELQDKAVR